MKWTQRDVVLIKKYGNRRLYDTKRSSYVTLPDIAEQIRGGVDVRVVDAKTNRDLTQETLMQIILDGRGAAQLLPVDLLTQLVRMEDAALGEFLGRYLSFALEAYLQLKQGAQALQPWNPFAAAPFAAASNLARMFAGAAGVGQAPVDAPVAGEPELPEPPPEAPEPPEEPVGAQHNHTADVEQLRRELAELKDSLRDLVQAARGNK